MKLYLNEEHATRKDEIVGIFDMDGATARDATVQFLKKAEKEGRCLMATSDIPVSFVVSADKENRITVFYTRNATKALRRRSERFGM